MLLEDHTMDYILRRVRKENSGENCSSRLFFSRGDLWVLAVEYKIRPGRRDPVDVTSISMRMQENNLDNGIRLLRPPSDPSGRAFLTHSNCYASTTEVAGTVFI
uniref:START domain-containing protein n=1 Tax=Haemonchus contortus TaxID=6289 RepID=A0A7I4Z5X3_HAECO